MSSSGVSRRSGWTLGVAAVETGPEARVEAQGWLQVIFVREPAGPWRWRAFVGAHPVRITLNRDRYVSHGRTHAFVITTAAAAKLGGAFSSPGSLERHLAGPPIFDIHHDRSRRAGRETLAVLRRTPCHSLSTPSTVERLWLPSTPEGRAHQGGHSGRIPNSGRRVRSLE